MLKDEQAHGYLEADTSRTKTSSTLEKKTRFLTMSCPVNTISGTPWVEVWLKLRKSVNLEAGPGKPLLPAPTETDAWSSVPLTASSAGSWLRALLDGHSPEKLGTHSLKTTLLSWSAKFGLSVPDRRALGYHQVAGDTSVFTYSRDALAGPLRQLQRVLDAIKQGEFAPDQTRSGYFNQTANDNNDDTSSESSLDEEDHDCEVDEKAIDAVAGVWQGNANTLWTSLAAVYFRHRSSRCIHILKDEAGNEFLCGRRISSAYIR
ncbi:MAG: hypothetical protein AAGJ35_10790, partial [Myxococcota bacterium]